MRKTADQKIIATAAASAMEWDKYSSLARVHVKLAKLARRPEDRKARQDKAREYAAICRGIVRKFVLRYVNEII